jgi:hypothetical protein
MPRTVSFEVDTAVLETHLVNISHDDLAALGARLAAVLLTPDWSPNSVAKLRNCGIVVASEK